MSGRVLGEYLELTKPRITLFILMSMAIGFLCAEHLVGSFSWLVLFHALMGTALLASGTAALNQWYEHEGDGKMRRTRQRPIPSGRMTPKAAFEFGLVLSIFGFLELWWGANLLTAMLGAFTEFTYLFLYTPLKKISPHSTTIGAIPGAMPPLIGYAAASGLLNWEAGVLYAILFLWQFPHFYAIAWMYREDYAKAGHPDAAGGGAVQRIDRAAHRVVQPGIDSDQPAAKIFRHGGTLLRLRSGGGRIVLFLRGRARFL